MLEMPLKSPISSMSNLMGLISYLYLNVFSELIQVYLELQHFGILLQSPK